MRRWKRMQAQEIARKRSRLWLQARSRGEENDAWSCERDARSHTGLRRGA